MGFDEKVITFKELLMSQVIQQEALTRLLVEKGIFTKEEFLEMVRIVNQEMKLIRKIGSGVKCKNQDLTLQTLSIVVVSSS